MSLFWQLVTPSFQTIMCQPCGLISNPIFVAYLKFCWAAPVLYNSNASHESGIDFESVTQVATPVYIPYPVTQGHVGQQCQKHKTIKTNTTRIYMHPWDIHNNKIIAVSCQFGKRLQNKMHSKKTYPIVGIQWVTNMINYEVYIYISYRHHVIWFKQSVE